MKPQRTPAWRRLRQKHTMPGGVQKVQQGHNLRLPRQRPESSHRHHPRQLQMSRKCGRNIGIERCAKGSRLRAEAGFCLHGLPYRPRP